MKLIEALGIISKNHEGEPLTIGLACGFTPLHFQTFLHAELQLLSPDRRVEITTGLYGDIAGTLRDAKNRKLDAMTLALEWVDLDPRLGIRQLGGWQVSSVEDILQTAEMKLALLEQLLFDLSVVVPVVVSLPTLPLPPLFMTPGWQSGSGDLQLRAQLSSFAASLARQARIRVVNEQRLQSLSPFTARLNVKSDWVAGFPYGNSHASTLARLMAQLIQNPLPRKGIITDLDNTLWSGIVGEVGPSEVHWDLDHHSQAHGLFQQFLKLLSEEGVLIGVASKNDPAVVEQAFQREDLLLSAKDIFPFEVSWGSKAGAVSRILEAWNIGPESVVFVDDSPLELAEVHEHHPQVECLQFPQDDPQSVYELLSGLRDRFGKSAASTEDRLRRESLRSAGFKREAAEEEGFSEALLAQAEAELVFSLRKEASDARPFELVNKTNQFNLNGRRFTEIGWHDFLAQDDRFLLTATYADRFGALGKIAVISGRKNGTALLIDSWVMSCRAFARRIEHQCLSFLFNKFQTNTIQFDYQETPRNGPVNALFTDLLKQTPAGRLEISIAEFAKACPALFHKVREATDD